MTNRLASETSPYLKQHAHNPVDWYPWGDEALQKARTEDKPILVSIGYSACHWCHVMERESFENQEIAGIMNQNFVCIKVDREERPDVDAVYMDALQSMGLRGGWPLNVFLMPDARPFYGGTYFPPSNWENLLKSIALAYRDNREKLAESAEGFTRNLQAKENEKYQLGEWLDPETPLFTPDEIYICLEKMAQTFDRQRGGMQRAPKFPMPGVWQSIDDAVRVLEHTPGQFELEEIRFHLNYTLLRIAIGGIYDHLGGGWTRYSTDAEWKVPHFEKMLYDNGQLLSLYSRYRDAIESEDILNWAATKSIAWLEREMTDPNGGFYAALDADSEGEEGKFYVWKEAEVDQTLGDNAEWFGDLYDIYEAGNWEDGNNVLHLEAPPPPDIWQQLQSIHNQLFTLREKRVHPGLDNKIICSWNGLMLNGLVDAYRRFGREDYLQLALKNARFIAENLTETVTDADGKAGRGLWHLYEPNRPPQLGFLEDYAAVIQAYLNLYQVTFDKFWLREAEQLIDYTIANFLDTDENLFYFTDSQGEQLIARKKELFDNVIPASNSIMGKNLLLAGTMLDRPDFVQLAKNQFAAVKPLLMHDPQWMSNWFSMGVLLAQPIAEVVIIGPEALDFRREMEPFVGPNTVFLGNETATSDLPLLAGRPAHPEKTMIYVCFNRACQRPVTSVREALDLLVDGD